MIRRRAFVDCINPVLSLSATPTMRLLDRVSTSISLTLASTLLTQVSCGFCPSICIIKPHSVFPSSRPSVDAPSGELRSVVMPTPMAMVTELTAREWSEIHCLLHRSLTFFSGTAAGSQYGVAKNANLIAVKVLSDAG